MKPGKSRSKWTYSWWLSLGKVLDRPIFAHANRLMARLECALVLPALERMINWEPIHGVRVFARQSALLRENFNPLFSDLDIGMSSRANLSDIELGLILRRWDRIKGWLPFLGELELFEESEWEIHQGVLSRNRDLFMMIRDIRKLFWIVSSDEFSKRSDYHAYKARRSIRWISRKWGGSGSDDHREALHSISKRISKDCGDWTLPGRYPPVVAEDVFADHLGWSIQALQDCGVDAPVLWLILAVTPCDARTVRSEAERILAALRSQPSVAAAYQDYLLWEYNQLKAVGRARPHDFPWLRDWLAELKRKLSLQEISSNGPDCRDRSTIGRDNLGP